MALIPKPLNTFTGCEDIQPHYTAWFDPDLGILHHISSKTKNAIVISEMPNGYLRAAPFKSNGKTTSVLIHRLVCEFFYGAPSSDKPQVNHINHNRSDNRASNLEWVSPAENCQLDPIWMATRQLACKIASSACSQPILISIDGKTSSYPSCSEAAHALGYAGYTGLVNRIQPLLNGEVDSVTYHHKKSGKPITVTLCK